MLEVSLLQLGVVLGTVVIATVALMAEVDDWRDWRRERRRKTCGDGGNHHFETHRDRANYRLQSHGFPVAKWSVEQQREYRCQHEGCHQHRTEWRAPLDDVFDARKDARRALAHHILQENSGGS